MESQSQQLFPVGKQQNWGHTPFVFLFAFLFLFAWRPVFQQFPISAEIFFIGLCIQTINFVLFLQNNILLLMPGQFPFQLHPFLQFLGGYYSEFLLGNNCPFFFFFLQLLELQLSAFKSLQTSNLFVYVSFHFFLVQCSLGIN